MDIIEYFTFLTGLIPTEDQKKLLLDLIKLDIKRILIAAGRQTGKTTTCAVVIFWLAFELDEEIKILIVAQGTTADPPIYTKIKEIFRRNRDYFINRVIIVNKYEDLPKYGFETRRGSYVHYRNATEGQVRGVSADFVFIDEAGIIKDDVTLSAYDCKSGKWSKFICLSTPPEKANLFTKWFYEAKELGFSVHHWSEIGLSWHSQDDLKFKKSQYSWQRYKREVLGEFLNKSEMSFFNRKHLNECWKESTISLEGGPNSYIWIGLDWGFSPCKSVVTIIEKLYSRRRVLLQKTWYRKPIEDYASELVDILSKFPSAIVKADSKPVEYKEYMDRNYPKLKIHYLDGVQHKDQELEQLQRHIVQHSLELSDMDIFKQLCIYKKGMRTGDLVDSLALACYEPNIPLKNKPVGTVIFSNKKNPR